jgi:hypothetical protein
MKVLALGLALLAVTSAAVALTETGAAKSADATIARPATAHELYLECQRFEPSCADFMDQAYDLVLANQADGRICDPWSSRTAQAGIRTARTPGKVLGRDYVAALAAHRNLLDKPVGDAASVVIKYYLGCTGTNVAL